MSGANLSDLFAPKKEGAFPRESFDDSTQKFFLYTFDCASARTNFPVTVPGFSIVYVDPRTTAANATIRFGTDNDADLPLRINFVYTVPQGVQRIFLTHTAQPGTVLYLILARGPSILPTSGDISTISSINSINTLVGITNAVKVYTDGVPLANGVKVLGFGTGDSVTVRGNQGGSSDSVKIYSTSGQAIHVQNVTGAALNVNTSFRPFFNDFGSNAYQTLVVGGFGNTGQGLAGTSQLRISGNIAPGQSITFMSAQFLYNGNAQWNLGSSASGYAQAGTVIEVGFENTANTAYNPTIARTMVHNDGSVEWMNKIIGHRITNDWNATVKFTLMRSATDALLSNINFMSKWQIV